MALESQHKMQTQLRVEGTSSGDHLVQGPDHKAKLYHLPVVCPLLQMCSLDLVNLTQCLPEEQSFAFVVSYREKATPGREVHGLSQINLFSSEDREVGKHSVGRNVHLWRHSWSVLAVREDHQHPSQSTNGKPKLSVQVTPIPQHFRAVLQRRCRGTARSQLLQCPFCCWQLTNKSRPAAPQVNSAAPLLATALTMLATL